MHNAFKDRVIATDYAVARASFSFFAKGVANWAPRTVTRRPTRAWLEERNTTRRQIRPHEWKRYFFAVQRYVLSRTRAALLIPLAAIGDFTDSLPVIFNQVELQNVPLASVEFLYKIYLNLFRKSKVLLLLFSRRETFNRYKFQF